MTKVYIWPNGNYHIDEMDREELEQSIEYNGGNFEIITVDDKLSTEELDRYVNEFFDSMNKMQLVLTTKLSNIKSASAGDIEPICPKCGIACNHTTQEMYYFALDALEESSKIVW